MTSLAKSGIARAAAAALCTIPLCLLAAPAFAALGSYPLTGADAHVMASSLAAARSTQLLGANASAPVASTAYQVNTVTLDTGTVVREYVATANNQVFGVAWHGPRLPDLSELLGASNFSRYVSASPNGTDKVTADPSHRGLSSSDLVVHTFGHIGNFGGVAYLPAALPAGVSATDIQ